MRESVKIEGVRLWGEGDQVVAASRKRWGGTRFEPVSIRNWTAAAEPGAFLIDVGAYTGIYSIAAALRGAEVLALEPNPAAVRRMRHNVASNGVNSLVTVIEGAAGEECGRGSLVERPGAPLSSACRVEYGNGGLGVIKLDSMVGPAAARVDAIKIDVERSEAAVLRGALRIIRTYSPLIVIEVLDPETEVEVTRLLEPLGYRFHAADGRNLICRGR